MIAFVLGGVALPLSSSPLPLQGALSASSFMPASQSHNAEMHPWDRDDDDGDVMCAAQAGLMQSFARAEGNGRDDGPGGVV